MKHNQSNCGGFGGRCDLWSRRVAGQHCFDTLPQHVGPFRCRAGNQQDHGDAAGGRVEDFWRYLVVPAFKFGKYDIGLEDGVGVFSFCGAGCSSSKVSFITCSPGWFWSRLSSPAFVTAEEATI